MGSSYWLAANGKTNGLYNRRNKETNLNTVDSFISSSSNMAYGIMKLVVSLVPPAFATLLKIVGFQGDREKGLESLWWAAGEHNIYGAFSGIVIFGYYNFIIGSSDIKPDIDSTTTERLGMLLADMRKRHPRSRLWELEEARMRASERKLEESRDMLIKSSNSPLKQIEALKQFELCIIEMFLHNYRVVSKSFQEASTYISVAHIRLADVYLSSALRINGHMHYITLLQRRQKLNYTVSWRLPIRAKL